MVRGLSGDGIRANFGWVSCGLVSIHEEETMSNNCVTIWAIKSGENLLGLMKMFSALYLKKV